MLFSRKLFAVFSLLFLLFLTQKASAETKVQINGQTTQEANDSKSSKESIIDIEITDTPSPSETPPPIEIQLPPEKIHAAPTLAPILEEVESVRARRHARRRITATPTSINTQLTPIPTRATPSTTPTRTVFPSKTPSPTPAKTVSAVTLDEKIQFIMDAINDYRKSYGLPSVKTNKYTCDFAKIRAMEIASAFNHDGFRERIDKDTLPYPSYKLVSENLARTADYKRVVTLWINSSGHAANMRRDTNYVCVQAYGDYYVYEGWRP